MILHFIFSYFDVDLLQAKYSDGFHRDTAENKNRIKYGNCAIDCRNGEMYQQFWINKESLLPAGF